MNKLMCLIGAGALCMLASCSSKSTTGFNVENLDTTTSPKQDFYQYACGGWMKNNPLKDEHARFGAFDKLREDNVEQVKTLILDLSANTSSTDELGAKIGLMYKIAMDTAKLDLEGAKPLQVDLKLIEALQTKEEAIAFLPTLNSICVFPFFQVYVDADIKNSSMNIMNLYQGGTALGDKDYYLSEEEHELKIREAYLTYVKNMFVLAGFDQVVAQEKAASILKIETELSKFQFSREEQRDPAANYCKITVKDLQKKAPAFNWAAYFGTLTDKPLVDLNVSQINYIVEVSKILQKMSLQDLKTYYEWNTISAASSYLSSDFEIEAFEFWGKTMSGKKEMGERWKRAVNTTNDVLGEAVGQLYVKKYFPPQSKEKMLSLVANVQAGMKDRINGLTWMQDSTKEKAIDKLSSMIVKIGYPETWRDYSGLEIKEDSYWDNIKRSGTFELAYNFSKLNEKVDVDKWLMTPQTVNAYYNPTTNEICFPAAILQPPFFYSNGDDAINYGAIGVVIAHEMTHGFDDQGRQFDKYGNLQNWWSEADALAFDQRTKVLVDYFNQITVIGNEKANGAYTLGENIADNGGVQISFTAFQKALEGKDQALKIDGFTQNQRFFLAYANVWAGNIRDEEIRRLTKLDVHSLGKWRVNGILPHVGSFIEAFDIKEGDSMYLAPEKRADIW